MHICPARGVLAETMLHPMKCSQHDETTVFYVDLTLLISKLDQLETPGKSGLMEGVSRRVIRQTYLLLVHHLLVV